MENTIQFIQTTPQQLEQNIIEGVKKMFLAVAQKQIEEEELLTRAEAAAYLKISKVTLWDWTCKKKIQSYGAGNKIYYKKAELLASLKKI